MRTVGTLDYGIDQKTGDDGAIRIAGDNLRRNNFFGNDDYALGGAHSFDHDAEVPPAVSVAFGVGALHMDDGHIGIQRPHRPQRLLRSEGREYLIEKMIALCGIATQCRFGRQKRDAHCASLQGKSNGEISHIEHLHSALFNGAAEIVGGSHHDVAYPSSDDLLDTSCADKLVKENVRYRADQS